MTYLKYGVTSTTGMITRATIVGLFAGWQETQPELAKVSNDVAASRELNSSRTVISP